MPIVILGDINLRLPTSANRSYLDSTPSQDAGPSMKRPLTMLEPTESVETETYRLHRRFDRMGRLVGDPSMQLLMRSHVLVVGLGGVGSFAAESLVRSGVGTVTVCDFDDVCITNTNRQLHAIQGAVGKKKAQVMAERLRRINPKALVHVRPIGYSASRAAEFLDESPSFVIDAIDQVTAKCHLLAECRGRNIPVVTATGSGGRIDPTKVEVTDLARTSQDPLARVVRSILRTEHDFPRKGDFGIPAVYSTERHCEPHDLDYDNGQGFRCVCPQGQNGVLDCDQRRVIHGNASFVTGTFGLVCASVVVRELTAEASTSG